MMKSLASAVKGIFESPVAGRQKNELIKLSSTSFRWVASESCRPCVSDIFFLPQGPMRLELEGQKLRLWQGRNSSARKPSIKINDVAYDLGSPVPEGDLDVVVETQTDEQVVDDDPNRRPSETMRQTIEVLGEDIAVWRIRFGQHFDETRSVMSKWLSDVGATLGRTPPDVGPSTHTEEGREVASSSAGDSSALVSTPFRLNHVHLGDFWLEFHPHGRDVARVIFRCGYPGLTVSAQVEVRGPAGAVFQKQVVARGRSCRMPAPEEEATLLANFGTPDAWIAPGEVEVRVQFLALHELPEKLR